MKNIKLTFIFISLAYLSAIVGCNSDKAVAPSFDTQLLSIPNGWKISAATISPAINGKTDYFQILPDCAKDNLMFFKKDGSYKIDDGSTKCDASDPQLISEGTWSFISANNLLAFAPKNPDDLLPALTIVSLSSTSFVYSSQLDLLGQNYTIKATLVPN